LVAIPEMLGWISPRLGAEFGLDGTDLVLIGLDGKRFESFLQQVERREQAEERAEQAEDRTERAVQRAKQAEERAEQAEERAEHLAARLRELGLAE
jgi:hypothetical protein